MKLSPAWKLASRGKSAKLVLAASTRMSMVPAWREKNITRPPTDSPKTRSAIWEITVGVPSAKGTVLRWAPRMDRPRNMTPSRLPMMTRVLRALRQAG